MDEAFVEEVVNKFRVTCLLDKIGDEDAQRVFATRKRFQTRESAETYAATVAESRKPMVGHCQFTTSRSDGHWTVVDDDEYDGPGGDIHTLQGDRFTELQAVNEFCELFDRCTVFFDGVPCGGHPMSVPDEGGSGWKRCSGCGML